MTLDLSVLTLFTATSVAHLMRWEQNLSSQSNGGSPRAWSFRGQPQCFGSLTPSFTRAFPADQITAAHLIERQLLTDFRTHYRGQEDTHTDYQGITEAVGKETDLRWLSMMQHFEVPTRLLDWTSDFWTAVYFACATDSGHDAEVWLYDRCILMKQGLSSSELSELARQSIGRGVESPSGDSIKASVLFEFTDQTTTRMKQQRAHHTVATDLSHNHAELLNVFADRAREEGKESFYFGRILIDKACKGNVIKFLSDFRGINASTLFPDVVGLGRYLRWQFESLRTMLL